MHGLQLFMGKMSAKTGEEAGDQTAEDKKGQIGHRGNRRCEEHGDEQLPQIVGERTEDTHDPGIMSLQKDVHEVHDKEAEKSAGQTVKQAYSLAEKNCSQEYAGQKYQEGLFQRSVFD